MANLLADPPENVLGNREAVLESWQLVPWHLHEGIVRYLDQRIPMGSFLTAAFENDFAEAANRSGMGLTTFGLKGLGLFLLYHVPPAAWGTPAKVRSWLHPDTNRKG